MVKIITAKDRTHYSFIGKVLDKYIKPIYGNQEKQLRKIKKGEDRTCKILLADKEVGLLIYKTELSEEYSNYSIYGALEIKTLIVVDPDKNSGRGYGSRLLQEAFDYAKSLNAESVVVTVSSRKPESLEFFQKKGFDQVTHFADKYIKEIQNFS
ncbi:MAG: GNAT family N-acetyltransferase [Patescibacteria group bacterium]